jgi:WD40 repeat protein
VTEHGIDRVQMKNCLNKKYFSIMWDLETGKKVAVYAGHTGGVMSISISNDSQSFISGACDASAKLWDLRDKKCERTYPGNRSDVNTIKVTSLYNTSNVKINLSTVFSIWIFFCNGV